MPNPMNGRRQELVQSDARLLSADLDLRKHPAFRLHVRRSLRMHPRPAGGVAGAVLLLLLLFGLSRKPSYSAESLIYVEPLEVRVLSDGSSSGYDPSRYDSYLQQQVQTVQRADTLEAALAKLPPGMWSVPGENPAAAVGRLEGALKVERVMNSYQLGIEVTASDPKAAAAAANAVTSAYLEEGRKDEHARADQRLQLLTEERQRITDDMTEDKAEQAHLGSSLGVANPNGVSGNPYDLQSEGLRSQLAAAREAHDTVAAQLASVSGANGTGLDTAANELIVADPGLVSVKQTLSQRRALLSDQMAGLTPANPVYRQDQEEINTLDRAMDRATAEARERAERQLQDKLRLDLRRTADVEGRLNAQLAEQTAKATGAGPKLQRAAELETDVQRLSARYATVDDAIRGLQLETSGPGQAHLALAARVPETAQPSRRKLILLLALPLALLCGLGAAVVARKRDHRLYLPDDLQEVLGFAPMCVLPDASEVSAAAYDDFVLRLAGGLEGAYRHGNARSFVVTPASVSTTVENVLPQLSAKLQQIGFRAGYIPADQLVPRLTGPAGEVALVRAKNTRPREGAAATQLEILLREYDIILIQAPPLLGSALTEYAVRCADATILLVESSRTDRADLRRAAVLLERLNPQGVGAVLQKLSMRYADEAFSEAVRAADHASLRHTERVVDAGYEQPAVAPLPQAPPLEPVRSTTSEEAAPAVQEQPSFVPRVEPPDALASADLLQPVEQAPSAAVEEVASGQGNAEEEMAPMKLSQRWKKSAEPEHQERAPAEASAPAEPADAQTAVPAIFFLEENELREDSGRWVPSGHGGFAPVPAPAKPAEVEAATPSGVKEEFQDGSLSSQEAWDEADVAPVEAASTEEWNAAAHTPEEPLTGEHGPGANLEAAETSEPRAGRNGWEEEEYTAAASAEGWTTASLEPLQTAYAEADRPVEEVQTGEEEPVSAESIAGPAEAETVPVDEPLFVGDASEPARTPGGWAAWTQTETETSVVEAAAAEALTQSEPEAALGTLSPIAQPAARAESSESLQPGTASEEPEPARQISWFRRLFGLEDEPALHISPVDQRNEDLGSLEVGAEAGIPPSNASVPAELVTELEPAAAFAPSDETEPAAPGQAEEQLELQPPSGSLETVVERPVSAEAELEESTFPALTEEAAHVHPEGRDVEQDRGADRMPPYLSIVPSERDETEAAEAEPAALAAFGVADSVLPAATIPATIQAESAAERPAEIPAESRVETSPSQSPARWVESAAPPSRISSAAPHRTETEAFPPPADERAPEPPLVAFPRIAPARPGSARPAVVAPIRSERPSPEEASRPEPARRPQRWEPVVAPPARIREATVLPQRPGLARALAQVAAEEGPPARASEGLTAMRTGAGLRKALVRQEAVLRSQAQEPSAPRPQSGMSRRWAMLSQFERSGSDAAGSADVEQRFPPASDRTAPPEPARNSGV